MDVPRRSQSADAAHRLLVERAQARTPHERIVLALKLGARCRALARAREGQAVESSQERSIEDV